MPDVKGLMDPIDPPPSLGKRPSWLRDTLEDAKGHMAPRGTFRERKKPNRYQGYLAAMSIIVQSEPGSFEEAVNHQEYGSIMKNDVWDVVPRPEEKAVVTSNGSTRSSMDLMEVLKSSRQDSLPVASLKRKA